MGQLEWYHGIEAAHQHSAYTLAWRLCRNEETVVKGFIRTAVDIAYKSVRRRDRRMRANDVRWKITLSDPQLLQIAILEATKGQGVAPRSSPWCRTLRISRCVLCLGTPQWRLENHISGVVPRIPRGSPAGSGVPPQNQTLSF